MQEPPYITRVVLRNYRSIATAEIKLQSLTFLVGPNGSGKSNFVDGLRFVAEALRGSLDQAFRERGGVKEVRRRSGGHPNHFGIRLDFRFPAGEMGHYAFQIGAKPSGGFEVQTEECVLVRPDQQLGEASFLVRAGRVVKCTARVAPPVVSDRLFLVAAAGLPEFRPVYDGLSHMAFYNLNPRVIALPQQPDRGELMLRDGSNCVSVLARLSPETRQRIIKYLARIVPGLSDVEPRLLGTQETLEFRQQVRGAKHPWRFPAVSMSDGTLRAFGVLLALFQGAEKNGGKPLLVGLEEPEIALHPASVGVLLGCLQAASAWSQILVTSHSPDLLDDPSIGEDSLVAVDCQDGVTRLGTLDEAGRSALRDRLFTPGELLRSNQLAPDPSSTAPPRENEQQELFDLSR